MAMSAATSERVLVTGLSAAGAGAASTVTGGSPGVGSDAHPGAPAAAAARTASRATAAGKARFAPEQPRTVRALPGILILEEFRYWHGRRSPSLRAEAARHAHFAAAARAFAVALIIASDVIVAPVKASIPFTLCFRSICRGVSVSAA